MSTRIKRIEKDFLIKVLYDEQIPILYLRDRSEYILKLKKPAKAEIVLHPNTQITKLKARNKMDLMFDYHGQMIIFSVEVSFIKDDLIYCNSPEFLYKNLERSFTRVSQPPDIQVQLTVLKDRYDLPYPKVADFEPDESGVSFSEADRPNLTGIIEQMANWVKNNATSYKLVLFKDAKPESPEESIVAETGKTLLIPSTVAGLPRVDPYPRKRIITDEMFKRYLESTGVGRSFADSALARFIKAKFDSGILSDLWIPVLFHEYVIGYVHVWISTEGKMPFDYRMIDTLYQFAKVLVYSLKRNGYFETGKIKNDPFEGKVIDMSVSGVLFASPSSQLASLLLPDSEFMIKIITPRRNVSTQTKIIRRYNEGSMNFFGCKFLDMAPEDMRFLFEFVYGKAFTDTDASFLTGQV